MSQHQPPLSTKFVTQQRKRLEALRRQLLGGEESTIANERASQEQHGEEAEEFENAAQEMSRHEINQALHDVNDQRIANIERALQKIADGSYGLSDLSGQPIPQDRLESTPEAVLTVQEERSKEKDRAR